jgi:hypothetical protein
MAAVVGFLVISFAIWGIGDIFRGFSPIYRGQDRADESRSSNFARCTTSGCNSFHVS